MAMLKAIDKIGQLNDEIARLEAEKKKLCDRVKDYRGVGTYEGEEYIGTVYESEHVSPDVEKLKRHFKSSWYKYLKTTSSIGLRVESKAKRVEAAKKRAKAKKIVAAKTGIEKQRRRA
jgi:hypothetical protein